MYSAIFAPYAVSSADFGVVYLGFTAADFVGVGAVLAPVASLAELLRAAVCAGTDGVMTAIDTAKTKHANSLRSLGDIDVLLHQAGLIYVKLRNPWLVRYRARNEIPKSSSAHGREKSFGKSL